MRVLIVDDERLARARLVTLLARLPMVTDVDEAVDAEEAFAKVVDFAPDVMLLDIHMPGASGVDLAPRLPASLGVVFVTADASRALDAFDAGAFDYVLKPVRRDRLRTALQRADGRRGPPSVRLLCRTRRGLRVVDAHGIARFRAQDKYTVFRHDGDDVFIERSLSALERVLPHMRVHRSELVDLAQVVEAAAGVLTLRDGQQVPVSRRRWPAVRRELEHPS